MQREDDRLSDALTSLGKHVDRLKLDQDLRRQEVQAADKALSQAKHEHMKGIELFED
jgi:outer membrane murein-binding lipoprotein Lpp